MLPFNRLHFRHQEDSTAYNTYWMHVLLQTLRFYDFREGSKSSLD